MTVLVVGYYGQRNLGDELMLLALRKWLDRQGIRLTVLSENPEEVRRVHGVEAVRNLPVLPLWNWWPPRLRSRADVIRALARHDGVMIGGGDVIRDDHGWRTFLFTIEKILLALLLRKRVYFVNMGLGRPHTRYGRAILGLCLRSARYVVVRDMRSTQVCCAAGAKSIFAPDIVAALPGMIELTSPVTPAKLVPPYIVVALRTDANAHGMFELTDNRIREFAAALDQLVERRGLKVVFMPFQETHGIADNEVHRRIRSLMQNQDRAEVRAWTLDLSNTVACIAGASAVVAMRLHAGVLAAALNRPFVMLPYDHKINEFIAVGGGNLVLSEDFDRREDIYSALEAVLEAPARLGNGLGAQAMTAWAALTLPV